MISLQHRALTALPSTGASLNLFLSKMSKLKKFKHAAKLISHSQNLHVKRKPVDVTLKVLIRCRPFSEDDQLGVFISDRPGEKVR